MSTEGQKTIALNKRARFDYQIEDRLEAGLALQGWEVKSLREGRVQFADCYVFMRKDEAFLVGCRIDPLQTISSHADAVPMRSRKLLLHRREIDRLTGLVDQKGKTIVPIALYWKRGKAKVEIGVATGKKQHDKRKAVKDRDWKRQQARIMKGR